MRASVSIAVICAACQSAPDSHDRPTDQPVPDSGAPADALETSTCPRGTVRVTGTFCKNVNHRCIRWLDPPTVPEHFRRCREYEPAETCQSQSRPMDFCIDRYEHKDYGSSLPLNWASWTVARETCEAESKRLCTDDEWTLACEGPAMLAFPYGNIRDIDGSVCNVGYGPDELLGRDGKLIDHRHPIGSNECCVSPYGVHDMVGNVGEWTSIPGAKAPFRAAGKGGWWSVGLRSRCRPTTFGHDEHYAGIQVGFRCCDEVGKR